MSLAMVRAIRIEAATAELEGILLHCEAKLEIVPGATHLFVEPGALESVASLAADWFERHLGASRPKSGGRSA